MRQLVLAALKGLLISACVVCIGFSVGYIAADWYWKRKPEPKPEPTPPPPPIVIDGGRVPQVWTRVGMAHVCPISANEAFTADHVAIFHPDPNNSYSGEALPALWGDRYGNSGTFMWAWSDIRRDLSFVKNVQGQFVGWFKIATSLPQIGDKIVIVGYDFDKGMIDKPMETKILWIAAGSLTYDESPGPGSSGSCILNQQGEVIGINVAMIHGNGQGDLLAGGWDNVPENFRQVAR